MCDVCGGATPDQIQQKLIEDIQEHGHQVRYIFGDHNSPPFAYTVGRAVNDNPDLFIVGLPPEHAMNILNGAAQWHEEGKLDLSDGAETGLLVANYNCRIIACDPWAAEMTGVTAIGEAGDSAFQIVWPDREGHFPGDADYDARYVQPTYPLGVMRMFAQCDSQGTAISETALCSEHIHRHREFDSKDGVTMHTDASGNEMLECQDCGRTL